MYIDYIADLKLALLGGSQIKFYIIDGVAHGALGHPASAKHIGSSDDRMTM